MKDIKERINKVENKVDELHKVVEARGHKHNENAQVMRDFANTCNQQAETNNKLIDKVAYLEKKEIIHDMMFDKIEKFGNETLEKLTAIETTLIKSATKESLLLWAGKFVFQLFVLVGIIVTVLKNLGAV